MPYFTFTRQNPNLDLLPVIGFQHFKIFGKPATQEIRLHNFCKEVLCIFFTDALTENWHNFFFLEGFQNFANNYAYLNLLGQGLFKNVLFIKVRTLFVFVHFC